MKRLLRVVASSLCVIGMVATALLGVGWWSDLLRQWLEARASLAMGAPVHLGALDGDGRGASDVTLYTPRGQRLHADRVRFDGPWEGVLVDGRLERVTLTLAEGRAEGTVHLDGRFAGTLRLAAGELAVRGRLSGGDLALEATSDDLNTAPFAEGRVALRATLFFGAERFVSLDAEGRRLGARGLWAQRVKVHLEALGERGEVALDADGVKGLDRVTLQAHGTMRRWVVDQLGLEYSGEKWRALRPLAAGGALLLGHGDERLRIAADWPRLWQGKPRAKVSGELWASRVTSLPGRARFRLDYDGRRARQPLAVSWADGGIEVEAKTRVSSRGLPPDAPLEGTVRLSKLSVAQLREVDGVLSLSGTVAAPHLDGEVAGRAETPLGPLPVSAQVDWGKEAIARLRLEVPHLTLTAVARVPFELAKLASLGDWRRLPLLLDGEVRGDAALLPLPLDGKLAGAVTVRGNLSHPVMTARLHGEGLRLLMDQPLPLTARLTLHDDVAEIDELELRHEGATLRARGRAQLDGSQLEARVEATHLPLQRGRLAGWLDGELALKLRRGADGRYGGEVKLLSGQAQVGRLAVDRELQEVGPLEDVVFVDGRREAGFSLPLARMGEGTTLTARLFQVKGPDVEVAFEGGLRIAGGKVRGALEALAGGWIELFSRRYRIEKLRLAFEGGRPTVEVRLTRPVAEAAMSIELYGPLDAPKVSLTCDPPIYDAAQLTALAMNADPGAHRDARDLAGALSNAILGRLKNELLPQLPIDVFKIESDRVEAGKLFGERFYLAWVHNQVSAEMARHLNRDQGQIEVRLPRGWLLETMYGDQGVGSLDLSWTRRF